MRSAANTDYAYIAGMIDADGFITIQRTTKTNEGRCNQPSVYHCLKVGISGTDRRPHDFAVSLFGGNVSRYEPTNPQHRPQFQWTVTGPTAVMVLNAIRPYLRVKSQQADIGLRFQQALEAHSHIQRTEQKPPYRITSQMRNERDDYWRSMLDFNKPRNLRIGKKAAGRLLDGVEWSQFPSVRNEQESRTTAGTL